MLVANFVVCWWTLQTVWTQVRPNILLGLIWVLTLWHSVSVPEFRKKKLIKKKDDKNMTNYLACKLLRMKMVIEDHLYDTRVSQK